MSRSDIVERGQPFSDKESRYSWKWEWLDFVPKAEGKSDEVMCRYGLWLRKVAISGKAYCQLCRKEICYANKGFGAITGHCETQIHRNKLTDRIANSHLPGQPIKDDSYGVHPSLKASVEKPETSLSPLTPVSDRVHNLTAMTLGFIAENSLSLDLTPGLIDFVKAMAADRKALDGLTNIAASTASYKLRHGVAKTLHDKIVEEIKSCPFSLNIDEAMSQTNKKVLAILTSHFSPSENRVVVHHFGALNLVRVSAETLFEEIKAFFTTYGLTWDNLVSVLMDSCRVMRGKKGGLETLLRQKAPHMLDIDGDTCHHANNAAQRFCKPFERQLESLLKDLHTEFHYSTELKDSFFKFCTALGIKATTPEEYATHRWLSVLDTSIDTLRLFDAVTLYVASFLMKKDLPIYKDTIEEVLKRRGVSKKGREAIEGLQEKLRKKWKSSFTPKGRDRKLRMVDKVFTLRDQTFILLHCYTTVLSLLKEYVLFFQKREPVMHRLHDKLEDLLSNFLSCFVKPESLIHERGQQHIWPDLTKIKLEDTKNLLPQNHFTIGTTASKLLAKQCKTVKKSMGDKLQKAFIDCGTYLQKTMPLKNKTLKICSVLDPVVRTTSICKEFLKKIPDTTNLVPEDATDKFEHEVNNFTKAVCPSSAAADVPVDVWWAGVCQEKYPHLTAAAKGLLSCFHGPMVESSFSEMGQIMGKEKTNMDVQTYMAIQTVKFTLTSKKQTAVQYFSKFDPVKEPVCEKLVKNMSKAWIANEERKTVNQNKKEKVQVDLGVVPGHKPPAKQQEKRRIMEEAAWERQLELEDEEGTIGAHANMKLKDSNSKKANPKKRQLEEEDEEVGRIGTHTNSDVLSKSKAKQFKLESFFKKQ